MSRPLDFDLISKMEGSFYPLAHHFVHDGTVVDAQDGNSFAVVLVKQELAYLLYIGNRDRLYAHQLFGQQKVGQGLLMQGIDFHQNDIRGIVLAQDGPPQQFLVTLPIQSTKQIRQVRVQAEDLAAGL